jgi:hypothetical protein
MINDCARIVVVDNSCGFAEGIVPVTTNAATASISAPVPPEQVPPCGPPRLSPVLSTGLAPLKPFADGARALAGLTEAWRSLGVREARALTREEG